LRGAAESLARGTDLTPAAYEAVLGGLAFHSREASANELMGNPPPLVEKASTVADALQSIGLLQVTPRWQDLIDGAPMQRLQAGGKAP
jgi:NitT/TauT family transport system substrate-binding protein